MSFQIDPAVREWLMDERCNYLPPDFRDFHDQKELFKMLFSEIDMEEGFEGFTWADGHIFTVDKLLWYLAAHGWTLQRCRTKLPFRDFHAAAKERREREAEKFRAMLDERIDRHLAAKIEERYSTEATA